MHLIPNKFDASVAFVVCEKEAYGFKIVNSNLWYNKFSTAVGMQICYEPLPPGDWEICFKHSEGWEEVYKKIVNMHEGGVGYIEYTETVLSKFPYRYATDSYHSLLRAHGIDLTKEIIVIKRK